MAVEAGSPLVSVCVPTYNGARFLGAALESASAQTLGDLEILVVDDGSSDGTAAIVEAHARRDPRVRLVRNEANRGLVGNWNRCVELARGEWVKFLFQDDLLLPGCLERMVERARDEGERCRFVACGRKVLADEGAEGWVVEYLNTMPTLVKLTDRTYLTPDEYAALHAPYLHETIDGEPPCSLLHRSVFEELGPFDDGFRQLCDLEYWLRVGSSFGIGIVHEDLAEFRAHGGSTTSSNLTRKVDVTDVDKILLTRKVQTDPRLAKMWSHVPKRWAFRNAIAVLSPLARSQAHVADPGFEAALRKDRGLALFYRAIRIWVSLLDGSRRLVGWSRDAK